jgi:uncharacterized RDD family membrane protein YckC
MENNQGVSENTENQDLLSDETYIQDNFVYASQGQRFLNWLIDNIALRLTLNYLVGEGIGYLLGSLFPEFFQGLAFSDNAYAIVLLIAVIIVYLCYILYYTLCEKLFKGYTLGKLITGTRAIRQDGGELTFRNALLRSLSRCVPFEVFSGFNTLTWHDSWTGTMVIKSR